MPDQDHPTKHEAPLLDRRQALALGVGAFVVASIPLASRGRRRLVRRRVPLMGTIGEVAVVRGDERAAQAAIDAAFEALAGVEARMSCFLPTSDVGRANRRAARETVAVSADTAFVLEEALRWAETTDGRFDPCLGRAARLWDVKHRSRPPAERSVRALAGRGLYRALDLDRDARGGGVRFADDDVAIDLGGIAKGYGVDAAVAALREHGIENGLVNVGGDLYALGRSEDGDAWTVGVRDAADATRIRETFAVVDRGVATSGDYRQFFEHRGTRYHHLIDPQTAAPLATGQHSVTVTAATCLTADAAATAVFGASRRAALALLERGARDARLL